MALELPCEVSPIRAGYRARCAALHLADHGRCPAAAVRNLERGLRLFFAALARTGRLNEELHRLGLPPVDGDGPVRFALIETANL